MDPLSTRRSTDRQRAIAAPEMWARCHPPSFRTFARPLLQYRIDWFRSICIRATQQVTCIVDENIQWLAPSSNFGSESSNVSKWRIVGLQFIVSSISIVFKTLDSIKLPADHRVHLKAFNVRGRRRGSDVTSPKKAFSIHRVRLITSNTWSFEVLCLCSRRSWIVKYGQKWNLRSHWKATGHECRRDNHLLRALLPYEDLCHLLNRSPKP